MTGYAVLIEWSDWHLGRGGMAIYRTGTERAARAGAIEGYETGAELSCFCPLEKVVALGQCVRLSPLYRGS